jgi:hypothetical protein
MADLVMTPPVRPPGPALEMTVVTLAGWAMLVAFAVSGQGMELSWDAFNHHIYLGWIADQSRFDKDFLPAGYQSLQFPYLYWPVYKLAVGGASARTAAAVLASLQALAVPAVWLAAKACMPGASWVATGMRAMAVVLAFMTGAVLSLFDASSNDLLAAIPLVWAIALALHTTTMPVGAGRRPALMVALSGLLAGVSVGCKLSNGPIAILLPLLWAFAGAPRLRPRLLNVAIACAATLLGTVLTYGYWGWQLWQHFGNPLYPFYDGLIAPLRSALGWAG